MHHLYRLLSATDLSGFTVIIEALVRFFALLRINHMLTSCAGPVNSFEF